MLRQILFKIARNPISSLFIGFAFEHLTPIMPIAKLFEDNNVIIFRHPVPYWEIHYLAVPKKRFVSFESLNLSDSKVVDIFIAIINALQKTIKNEKLEIFTIQINGGEYQDVPQLHIHLHNGLSVNGRLWEVVNYVPLEKPIETLGYATLFSHHQPSRELHRILTVQEHIPNVESLNLENIVHKTALIDILKLAQLFIRQNRLNAYSIIINNFNEAPKSKLIVHLVSGPHQPSEVRLD